MGLDVYKYKVISENIFGEKIAEDELKHKCNEMNLHYVIFKYHQEYSHENNIRLLDLFVKFKDYSGTVILDDLIDYKYYDDMHSTNINELDVVYGYNMEDKHHIYSSNELFMNIYNEYKSIHEPDVFNARCYILKCDGVIIDVVKDIKTYIDECKYILFKETAYQRSGELHSLYDNFYGDCWYKKEGTGLDMKLARHFVYPEELLELKQSFHEHSSIQSWHMEDDEVIYINP